ncbi:hypothetical protein OJAV_G00214450 [Oryzias javanicus]|uniref:SSD domain-containing protein n=1 Tax=Oryzias javanicus TaxID=123683 RepID=A0A3S2P4Q4_ORYJA|nr:hypothetical protein OJAV_G00214450 [Oryzias javanicus]
MEMDDSSKTGESTDAIVTDESPVCDRDVQQAGQSDIPVLSVCPPDGSPETQLTISQSDRELCDSCSSLGRPSSSFQLYHQVPHCLHHSPKQKQCRRCGPGGSAKPHACHACPSNAAGCHGEGNVLVKVGHSCGSAHQTSSHGAVRCHWLHGSNESRAQKPRQHHVVTVRYGRLCSLLKNYSRLIVDYPLLLLLGCAALLLGCSMAGLLIGPLPDFSDPLLGFEPRGTFIGVRLSSLSRLQENTGPGKTLTAGPQQLSGRLEDVFSQSDNGSRDVSRGRFKRMLATDSSPDAFLCDAPGESLARLVFRSENSASLWSLKAIHAMCEMEESRIRSQAKFQDLCQQHVKAEGTTRTGCCPSWSLGNYLAVLSNASCCLSLNAQQVSDALKLLRKCAPYYHEGHLVESCVERPRRGSCSFVPSRCKQSRVVFQILHFLVDKDFLGPDTVEYQIPTLKYSLMFLPMDKGEPMMDVYMNSLESRDLTYNNTTITGIDFGIKRSLFKHYLARDSVYLILAVFSLLFTMVLYLNSVFIVALSILAIAGALLTSYFFYKVVFRLTFFPMINLEESSQSSSGSRLFDFGIWANRQRGVLVRLPQQHHGDPMFLCLSGHVFVDQLPLGLAVAAMRVYIARSLQEGPSRVFSCSGMEALLLQNRRGVLGNKLSQKMPLRVSQKLREIKRGLADTSSLLFLKILPCGVVKFRYIWVCWFAVLAAGGTYMSCVKPGMKLPTLESQVAQLFRSSHPFERYDAEYSHVFMFERQKRGEDRPVTLMLVWGVKPTDNGDHLDPRSSGSLVLDPEFNMSRPEAQIWLRDLCGRVQNQSFYSPPSLEDEDAVENICLVDQLVRWVSSRRCSDDPFCCGDIRFPYPPNVFESCLSLMLVERFAGGRLAPRGGLYFYPDGRVAALVLIFKTTYLYSFNYSRTGVFYQEILTWFNGEMSGAPQGLEKGWFVGPLSLYDLQQSLSTETLVVAGSSVALAFVFLLLTTWNIALSIYATAAVGGTVFVTVGLLVLLEWQLSGIEALFISAAAVAVLLLRAKEELWSDPPTMSLREKDGAPTSSPEPGSSSSSAANGAFSKSRVKRSYSRERGGYLYPHHQQKQMGVGGGANRRAEEYELQPLAYRLSDSFENSTCTSKLSNRPSVLSDEIEYCEGELGNNTTDKESEETCSHAICQAPPALQTSSPYREHTLHPSGLKNAAADKRLCKTCTAVVKEWSDTPRSSSSSLISQTLETSDQHSLCEGENAADGEGRREGPLLSCSQSSCEGLEDSCDTCLSDVEAGPSRPQGDDDAAEVQLQPGHLNGRRDALRLSLRETVYEAGGKDRSSRSEEVVILPNSKPDLPDVWIKRDGQQEATC